MAVISTPPAPPVAGFTGSPTSGVATLTVNFTDSSTGTITNRQWVFGDGGTSTATNPSHLYSDAGTYSVTLTVFGPGGSNALTRSSYIVVSAPPVVPVANFSASPTDGRAPLTVTFTDLSIGTITNRLWAFGDGGTSAAVNPSHTYANVGVYSVSLTVAGPTGSSSTNLIGLVQATTNRAPVFVTGPLVTNALLQVDGLAVVLADVPAAFLALATDPDGDSVGYRWNLGDGTTALGPTASQVYSSCLPYHADVTASDGLLSNTTPLTVSVPCEFAIDKLQAKIKFSNPDGDRAKLQGTVDLAPAFVPAGQQVVIDIGGAALAFVLDDKGKGANLLGKCKFKYSSKTTNWVVKASFKKGTWSDEWADDGLVNATIAKPGTEVTLPVIIVVGDDAFMQERLLFYTAKQDKSGKAK
ncbi:PKD domain-containing protein [bacterium]|nr:PKD domain-containing protein [bacterium]